MYNVNVALDYVLEIIIDFEDNPNAVEIGRL